ncbi:hypothetical protein JRQ81_018231 [Phrynocephalus forsythii]|uniref:Uncharacterized protein n=1 Tax=Phrynocephalus forsythii TaxID=171643 RepID=A0A9Q1B0X6_9SAUR|nr:hypothetical protein JRQ81_018231 [Phrynocephalus forsythii]
MTPSAVEVEAEDSRSKKVQVKYKSDLNWIRGIGWTPPGSYKVEMARRAAELAYAREELPPGTWDEYALDTEQAAGERSQQGSINADAAEILQVKRRKMKLMKK